MFSLTKKIFATGLLLVSLSVMASQSAFNEGQQLGKAQPVEISNDFVLGQGVDEAFIETQMKAIEKGGPLSQETYGADSYSEQVSGVVGREGILSLVGTGDNLVNEVSAPHGICADSDCVNEKQQPDLLAERALSAFAGIGLAGNDFATHGQVFAGTVRNCRKLFAKYRNCCVNRGWGKNIGSECATEEKQLAKENDNSQCHYLGEYCQKKGPTKHTCLKKKKAYCCYASPLSKIIQQAAHVQLNLAWPKAKHAVCRGLTTMQLSSLDLSRVDFGQYYASLQKDLGGKQALIQAELKRLSSERRAS